MCGWYSEPLDSYKDSFQDEVDFELGWKDLREGMPEWLFRYPVRGRGELFSASPNLVIGNSLPTQGLILQLGCKTKGLYNSVDYVSGSFWGCVLAIVQSR